MPSKKELQVRLQKISKDYLELQTRFDKLGDVKLENEAHLKVEIANLRFQKKELEKETAVLSQEHLETLLELEKKIDELENKLKSATKKLSLQKSIYDEVDLENEKYENVLDPLGCSFNQIDDGSCKQNLERLREKLTCDKPNSLDACVEKEIEKLNKGYKEQIDKFDNSHKHLEEKYADFIDLHEKVIEENDDLSRQVRQSDKEIEKLNKKLDDYEIAENYRLERHREELNSERLFNLEIAEQNYSLVEEIEKAHTTLGCGGLKLDECAEKKMDEFKKAQENNEKLLYRNKNLFEENATLTDRGYNFAQPTRATGRTAKTNNRYFRPGTIDAARYPPYPGFPM